LFFLKLKIDLKGQKFANIPDIQQNVMSLRGISENDFQDCFSQWQLLSRQVHSFTRSVFRRKQQPLVRR
jgi:hypothetical protein